MTLRNSLIISVLLRWKTATINLNFYNSKSQINLGTDSNEMSLLWHHPLVYCIADWRANTESLIRVEWTFSLCRWTPDLRRCPVPSCPRAGLGTFTAGPLRQSVHCPGLIASRSPLWSFSPLASSSLGESEEELFSAPVWVLRRSLFRHLTSKWTH